MKKKEEMKSAVIDFPLNKSHHRKREHSTYGTFEKFLSILFMAFGVCCLFWTQAVYCILPFALGGGMVVMGGLNILWGIADREFQTTETKVIANGIVYLALGIVILCHYKNADSIIGSIWGVLGLLKGAEAFNISFYRMTQKEAFLWDAFRAVIELILGLMLLLTPDTAVYRHVFILGLELLVSGGKMFHEIKL